MAETVVFYLLAAHRAAACATCTEAKRKVGDGVGVSNTQR